VLDVIEAENLIEQARTTGKNFKIELQELAAQFPQKVKEVKGRGLMLGLGLSFEPPSLVSHLRENGLITVGAAGNTLRLLPPLTVKNNEIAEALEIIKSGLAHFK
jgi:acetylornithine/succinyldiaminopimelate/putrescine aminotransferase